MTTPKYSIDEVCDRGEQIYEEQIKSLVEPQETGKCIVIDIETGDYELGEVMLEASLRLRGRRPDSVRYGAKVGSKFAYRMGRGADKPR